jgi:hypothetical protein
MKSFLVAIGIACAVTLAGGGVGYSDPVKIECAKAMSKDACLTLNNASPKAKSDHTVANSSCCYGCAACGANMVDGICATCSVR